MAYRYMIRSSSNHKISPFMYPSLYNAKIALGKEVHNNPKFANEYNLSVKVEDDKYTDSRSIGYEKTNVTAKEIVMDLL